MKQQLTAYRCRAIYRRKVKCDWTRFGTSIEEATESFKKALESEYFDKAEKMTLIVDPTADPRATSLVDGVIKAYNRLAMKEVEDQTTAGHGTLKNDVFAAVADLWWHAQHQPE